jgi:hypothetical protein
MKTLCGIPDRINNERYCVAGYDGARAWRVILRGLSKGEADAAVLACRSEQVKERAGWIYKVEPM